MKQEAVITMANNMERLIAGLDAQPRPAPLDNEVRLRLEEFLHLAASVTQGDWQKLLADNPMLLRNEKKLKHAYGQYISEQELAEAEEILSRNHDIPANASTSFLEAFGTRVYQRVSDMFSRVDLSVCRRFVMVGCGPLPGTLLHVLDSTNVPHIVGLDTDKAAVAMANRLIERFGLTRVQVVHGDGRIYDYKNADMVYIANLVRGKSEVLRRVADTAGENIDVVLRDPYFVGSILTESGVKDLDSRFILVGHGERAPEFWSRHIFLRVKR